MTIEIRIDDLTGAETQALIAAHLAGMHESSPPESVHALDVEALRDPGVTFWSAWIDGRPVENYMAWLGLTASITVVGHPVVALPCGIDDAGMPFGIQVIGPMYGDRTVLAAARALESALAADPVTARPRPDLERLAATPLQPFDPAATAATST